MTEEKITRREVLKKAAYITPVILTMPANFSFASAGSGNDTAPTRTVEYLGHGHDDEEDKNENDKKHKTKKKHDKHHKHDHP